MEILLIIINILLFTYIGYFHLTLWRKKRASVEVVDDTSVVSEVEWDIGDKGVYIASPIDIGTISCVIVYEVEVIFVTHLKIKVKVTDAFKKGYDSKNLVSLNITEVYRVVDGQWMDHNAVEKIYDLKYYRDKKIEKTLS